MRAVVQRVTEARVTVDGEVTGEITEPGLCVLVGVTHDDTPAGLAPVSYSDMGRCAATRGRIRKYTQGDFTEITR